MLNYYANINSPLPTRGTIVFGDIEFAPTRIPNAATGSIYYNYSIYGKALVEAYTKSDQQDWAGAYIDESVWEKLYDFFNNNSNNLIEYQKGNEKLYKYNIPLKDNKSAINYALRLHKGRLTQEAYRNYSEHLERNFKDYNKNINSPGASRKLENTIAFLHSFLMI